MKYYVINLLFVSFNLWSILLFQFTYLYVYIGDLYITCDILFMWDCFQINTNSTDSSKFYNNKKVMKIF